MNGSVTLGPAWDQIRAAGPSLHPSQRRVAAVLLGMSGEELARASAVDVAERSGTSPATVVRTCQQLGFSGFRECAMRLVVDISVSSAADDGRGALDIRQSDATTSAAAFYRAAATALTHAAATIDGDVLAAVAAELVAARRILIVTYGWSVAAGEALGLGLGGLGLAVEAPADFQRQIVVAGTLRASDVCVVVCFTGSHRHARLVARVAEQAGATVLLVSTFSRSLTARHAHHNLIFGGLETGGTHPGQPISAVVQFATMEAIRLAVVAELGPEAPAVSAAVVALVEGGVDEV